MANIVAKLLVLAAATSLLSVAAATSVAVGERAPDFALQSLEGTNLRLSEFRSEVVVLNFWAPWCNKCRDTLQSLDTLYRDHQADGLQVLAVGIEKDPEHARELISELRTTFPVVTDGKKSRVSRLYDLGKLPLTIVIDREGNVRHVHEGAKRNNFQQIQAQVSALLTE